jgi:YaaC-like Protein
MRGAVNRQCKGDSLIEAVAFLEQARDFFTAARSEGVSSNPLILYYAFLNLAKALILTLRQEQ